MRNFTDQEWKTYDAYVSSKESEIVGRGLEVIDVYHAALENLVGVADEEMLSVAMATVDYYIDQGM